MKPVPLPNWLPRISKDSVQSCLKALKAGRLAKAARCLGGEEMSYWGPTAAAAPTFVRDSMNANAERIGKCVLVLRQLVAFEGAEVDIERLAARLTAEADPELVVETRPFRLAEGVSAWVIQFFPPGVGPSSRERERTVLLTSYLVARLDSPWHALMEVLDT